LLRIANQSGHGRGYWITSLAGRAALAESSHRMA